MLSKAISKKHFMEIAILYLLLGLISIVALKMLDVRISSSSSSFYLPAALSFLGLGQLLLLFALRKEGAIATPKRANGLIIFLAITAVLAAEQTASLFPFATPWLLGILAVIFLTILGLAKDKPLLWHWLPALRRAMATAWRRAVIAFGQSWRPVMLLLILYLIIRLILAFTYVENDEANLVYDAKLIVEGKVPLKDFLARGIPLIYFYAIFVKLFGANLYVIKVLNAFLSTGTLLAIYLIGAALHSRKAGLIAASLFAVSPISLLTNIVTSVSLGASFPVALGTYFFIKSEGGESKPNLFIAGILFSIAYFIRGSAGVYIFLLVLLFIFSSLRPRPRLLITQMLWFTLGGMIPATIIWLFFTWQLGFPAGIIQSHDLVGVFLPMERLGLATSLASIWLTAVMSIYLLALTVAGLAFTPMARPRWGAIVIWIWLLSYLGSYIILGFHRGFSAQFSGEFIAPLSLLAALFITHFQEMAIESGAKTAFIVITTSLVLICTLTLPVRPFFVKEGTLTFVELLGSGVTAETTNKVATYIREHSGPNDEIAVGALQYATQSGRRQMLDLAHAISYNGQNPGVERLKIHPLAEIISYFASHPVRYLIEDDLRPAFPYLDDIKELNYKLVATINGVRIYERAPNKGFAEAAQFVKDNRSPADIVLSSSMLGHLYLGSFNFFALEKGYENYVEQRDGKLVDRWKGAPLLKTTDQLKEVLQHQGRVWFIVPQDRYLNNYSLDFRRYVRETMQLVALYDGVRVYVHDTQRQWPTVQLPMVNLVKNGDFEGLNAQGEPKDWLADSWRGSTQLQSIEQEEMRGNVAKIAKTNGDGGASYVQRLPVKPEQAYHFQCRVKGSGARIVMEFYTSSGYHLERALTYAPKDGPIPSSTEWHNFTFEVEAPAEAATVLIRLAVYGVNTAWFDNIVFNEVEE
ncbi:MAG: glycosyltransferase family 39 protein [Chloroflexi bacterium]|nr:glycosyltransferase family 39 protein [Chloroflexota bacterium]MCL5075278.1 glycosyltransferase family 39 protein [Chloroflexota bacterium]